MFEFSDLCRRRFILQLQPVKSLWFWRVMRKWPPVPKTYLKYFQCITFLQIFKYGRNLKNLIKYRMYWQMFIKLFCAWRIGVKLCMKALVILERKQCMGLSALDVELCVLLSLYVLLYMNLVNTLMRVMVSCYIILEAHSKYFISFRDLKIENLLLDEDNNIKLIGMKPVWQFQ